MKTSKLIKTVTKKINFSLLYFLLSIFIVLTGTYLAIQYAKGDLRPTDQGFATESGMLSANSFPPGAKVLIDGKPMGATDDTFYLVPGEYDIEIVDERRGFFPWKKTVTIQKGLVTQTNARLFKSVPSLTPLTFNGTENLTISPNGQKIVYFTASASAEKNGLYLVELESNNFNFFKNEAKQLTLQAPDLTNADYIWSPDSSELLLITQEKQSLIDLNKKNKWNELQDLTSFEMKQLLSLWEEEMYQRERQFLANFPDEIIEIATSSAFNVYLSPDKEKMLYQVNTEITLPENLILNIIPSNTQPEQRNLKPGKYYIYDRMDDKNYELSINNLPVNPEIQDKTNFYKHLLATDLDQEIPMSFEASPAAFTKLQKDNLNETALNFNIYHSSLFLNTLQWFPDSRHLMYIEDNNIYLIEYDNTNRNKIPTWSFYENFIYPWPDGSKIIIISTPSEELPKNLYSVDLK